MKTLLWVVRSICKGMLEILYDDIIPITPHSIGARREYKKIKDYHTKIIEFYNSLFNAKLPKPKMKFGRKWQYKEGVIYFGLPEGRDEALFGLSHEEGHRFYHEVNSFGDNKKDAEDNTRLVARGLISEAVAFYASGRFMDEIGREEISRGLETWVRFFGCRPYNLLDPVNITKLLYSKGEEFFKEFVRLDPLEAVKILNPELKIEDCWGYTIRYPSIEELVSYADLSHKS